MLTLGCQLDSKIDSTNSKANTYNQTYGYVILLQDKALALVENVGMVVVKRMQVIVGVVLVKSVADSMDMVVVVGMVVIEKVGMV